MNWPKIYILSMLWLGTIIVMKIVGIVSVVTPIVLLVIVIATIIIIKVK